MDKQDLNQAAAADLVDRLGIGRSLGRDIVKYRRLFGSYTSLDQLHAVPGMTPQLVAKIDRAFSISVDRSYQQPVTIQLLNPAGLSYLGHLVTLNFSRRRTLTTAAGVEAIVWTGEQVAADSPADGRMTFALPVDLDRGADLYLRVFSNHGALLFSILIPSNEISGQMCFEVEPGIFPAPRLAKPEPADEGDSLLQTLTDLLEQARERGVRLIEAPAA